jgi:hypothetical protein
MTNLYFLRIGNDYLDASMGYFTKSAALDEYEEVAREAIRFGNTPPEATIHMAPGRGQLQEYPDFVLTVGPRGGIRCERA